MAPEGFTGLVHTPTATVLPAGALGLGYGNAVAGAYDPKGHSLAVGVGFGLTERVGLEVIGRIAANDLNCRFYFGECPPDRGGLRDIAAGAKLAAQPLGPDWPSLAFGVTDYGGAATHFRQSYGVLTQRWGNFSASLGGAKAQSRFSPIDGAFGSVAWRPLDWVETFVEHDSRVPYAGIRFIVKSAATAPIAMQGIGVNAAQEALSANPASRVGTPAQAPAWLPPVWLPAGWQIHAGLSTRLQSTEQSGVRDPRTVFSFGLQIPLNFASTGSVSGRIEQTVPSSNAGLLFGASALTPRPAQTAVAPPASMAPPESLVPRASMAPRTSSEQPAPAARFESIAPAFAPQALARQLAHAADRNGLRSIWVGFAPNSASNSLAPIVLRFDAGDWAWSDADAFGAALAALATVDLNERPYRLILTKWGIPVVGASGDSSCLHEALHALKAGDGCANPIFKTVTRNVAALQSGVAWAQEDLSSVIRSPRFSLFPTLVAATATEYGLYDASSAASFKAEFPLWTGGVFESRYDALTTRSQDFAPGGYYGPYRLRSGVARAMLHQYQSFASIGLDSVWARVGAGKIAREYAGFDAELRWAPGDGRHRGLLRVGRFRRPLDDEGPAQTAQPRLASWRWSAVPGKWDLEASAGEFFNRDRGTQVLTKHWFGDTVVAFYFRESKKPLEPRYKMAGIAFEFPLTPRRDLRAGEVALRGTPRFGYGIESVVGGTANPVLFGYGVFLPDGMGLNETVFDRDRLEPINLETQKSRILTAARQILQSASKP